MSIEPGKLSLKSNIKKSKNYISLVLSISWVFGFTTTSIFDFSNPVFKIGIMSIFAFIPAIIAFIINKKEGNTWKDLKFFRPSLKSAIWAFLIPILYFGLIISIQILIKIRTLPDWSIIGSPAKVVTMLVIFYPIMTILVLGEEIGWRGYLQEKLIIGFGEFKGVLILGVVWGIWHLPIALQGYNFPNHPYIEAFITYPLVGISLSFIIAYLGYNKYSIFIGALLHASNNHFGSTLLALTKTNNEFMHAMIFNTFYVLMILVFGFLWNKKIRRAKPIVLAKNLYS